MHITTLLHEQHSNHNGTIIIYIKFFVIVHFIYFPFPYKTILYIYYYKYSIFFYHSNEFETS